MSPEVSVIVPVYNRAAMVGRAIESVLGQTFQDLEVIVVDDGSTDDSMAVVRAIADPRVRLIQHDRNRGIPAARNSGVEAATGRYLAWLDSDDLARPTRLAVQRDYLEANGAVAMIGSCAGAIRAGGSRKLRPRRPPYEHDRIVATLLFRSAFQQSSIMGRAEILRRYPYRPEFPVCEDVDMFIRLTRDHRTANLRDVLIDRRLHAGQTVHEESPKVAAMKKVLFRESLSRLGIDPDDDDLDRHVLLGNIKKTPVNREFLQWSEQWLTRIIAANRSAGIYDSEALETVVRQYWHKACRAARRGPDAWFGFSRSWFTPRALRLLQR
jgi:glycosyltransferase involved in cell wall biosynthesis